jgi:hypothetical protein
MHTAILLHVSVGVIWHDGSTEMKHFPTPEGAVTYIRGLTVLDAKTIIITPEWVQPGKHVPLEAHNAK